MNATVHAASLAPSLTLPWPLPPVLFVDSPNAGPAAGGDTVTLTGLGLNAATQVHFGSAPATIVSGDVLGFSLVVVAPPGSGTVAVTVTTPNGTSNPVAYTYLVASPTPAPNPAAITPVSGPVAGGIPFVITGTGLAGASVTFGGAAATVLASAPNVIAGLTPAHAAGTVPVVVTTVGGSASVPGGFTYLSSAPPVVTTPITPVVSIPAGGGVFTIVGTGLTGATVTFGTTTATITTNTGTVITGIIPAGTAGTTVPVTVTTPGGTVSGGTMTYVAVPVVTATVSPSSSIAAGGGVFTIAGTGLTGATVTFGTTTATITTNTGTVITGIIPA
ncbi:IPT/TIG domain-containing protein, partial [Kitasatospora sp. NPDC018058]|uniref:IPT/TIG domain-containing protein n=1 Tax=Kitasatospora sp. NPDC018058 TaxID=3364025 RepID=UPI0037C030FE